MAHHAKLASNRPNLTSINPGVTVSTQDSESIDPSSNLGGPVYCFDGKTSGAARSSGHVSSILCQHSFHKQCINQFTEAPTFWTCPLCRNLAAEVKIPQTKLQNLTE